MKIVLAVHHFPPHHNGGAEWRAYRTAAALQNRGHQVHIVAVERIDGGPQDIDLDDTHRSLQGDPQGGIGWIDDVFEGAQVRRLYFNKASISDRFRWGYDNPWIGAHFKEYFEKLKPDIFHLIGGYLITGSSLMAACDTLVPSVVTLTDFWFLCPRISMLRSNGNVSTLPINPITCARCLAEEKRRFRIPGRLLPGIMDLYWTMQKEQAGRVKERLDFLRRILNLAGAVISPSQFLRSVFIDAGVCPERIIFSRQGRDFPNLKPEMLEKKPSSQLRIGYMGQIIPIKGVHILLEAIQKLAGLPLTVSVYGEITHDLKYAQRLQRIVEKDARLSLKGAYRREEISGVFQRLDLVVVPSLWYENSPNVILEAFAHKTPVIASNLGGMAELVMNGKNGLLFENGNASDLAQKIKQLVEDPEMISRLRAGIGPVKSGKEEMDQLEVIYQRVLGTSALIN